MTWTYLDAKDRIRELEAEVARLRTAFESESGHAKTRADAAEAEVKCLRAALEKAATMLTRRAQECERWSNDPSKTEQQQETWAELANENWSNARAVRALAQGGSARSDALEATLAQGSGEGGGS